MWLPTDDVAKTFLRCSPQHGIELLREGNGNSSSWWSFRDWISIVVNILLLLVFVGGAVNRTVCRFLDTDGDVVVIEIRHRTLQFWQ